MTCKFVLKCIIREKWLVNDNELIKGVVEIFSIMIGFCFSMKKKKNVFKEIAV